MEINSKEKDIQTHTSLQFVCWVVYVFFFLFLACFAFSLSLLHLFLVAFLYSSFPVSPMLWPPPYSDPSLFLSLALHTHTHTLLPLSPLPPSLLSLVPLIDTSTREYSPSYDKAPSPWPSQSHPASPSSAAHATPTTPPPYTPP